MDGWWFRGARVLGEGRRVAVGCLLMGVLLAGCGNLKKVVVPQKVYVTAKQAYLRDRVAAVSNRTGEVQNGDTLTVLGHQRRFLQVRSPSGAVGWIEEKLTADQAVADQFDGLKDKHEKDPVISQAVTRDEVYLHLSPGRDTTHFYRLGENEPLSLLTRASVPKALPPGTTAASLARPSAAKLPVRESGSVAAKKFQPAAEVPTGPPAPVMEDWYLVRHESGPDRLDLWADDRRHGTGHAGTVLGGAENCGGLCAEHGRGSRIQRGEQWASCDTDPGVCDGAFAVQGGAAV